MGALSQNGPTQLVVWSFSSQSRVPQLRFFLVYTYTYMHIGKNIIKRRHNHDKVNPKVNNGESRSSQQNVSMYCQQFFCHILLSWQLILLFLSLVCISGSVRGDWWWMKTTKQLSRKLFLPTLRFSQEILQANCIVYCRELKHFSFSKLSHFVTSY